MKKIAFSIIVLIAFKANTQIISEEVLADGSHLIQYVPRHFSEEELANFRRRQIPSPELLQQYPLITLSNQFMDSVSIAFNINVEQDSTLEESAAEIFQSHIDPNFVKDKSLSLTFYQIWTLTESIVYYKEASFTHSIVNMIKQVYRQNSLHKNSRFFCKEFEYKGKYYLIAVIK